ncbi:pkaR [Symbiodinium natans]|uniref:PkaR protein n=1 Tax=Symbiodinium natans TaxID=878477 RepID=A0A812Q746_9DINO|nr:pkaR [Symbiodinium natans]
MTKRSLSWQMRQGLQIQGKQSKLEKKCFEEGEVIVRQGESGSELYVVLKGTCVVTVETGSNDDQGNPGVQALLHKRHVRREGASRKDRAFCHGLRGLEGGGVGPSADRL